MGSTETQRGERVPFSSSSKLESPGPILLISTHLIMSTSIRCFRPALLRAVRGGRPAAWMQQRRDMGTIRVIDEKRSGEETVYFKKEDDALLRNLLANHPEYDPKYTFSENDSEFSSLGRDIHLVCQKHGMKYTSVAFLKDIRLVFEAHGWTKPSQQQN